jgi:hypothetical protein
VMRRRQRSPRGDYGRWIRAENPREVF